MYISIGTIGLKLHGCIALVSFSLLSKVKKKLTFVLVYFINTRKLILIKFYGMWFAGGYLLLLLFVYWYAFLFASNFWSMYTLFIIYSTFYLTFLLNFPTCILFFARILKIFFFEHTGLQNIFYIHFCV